MDMKTIHMWAARCLLLGVACLCAFAAEQGAGAEAGWPTIETPEVDPISSITMYSEDYLDWMDQCRRGAGGAGLVYIYPEAARRARHYRDMLDNEGPAALAKAMVAAYPSDKAFLELAAGAIAMAARTGYMAYGWGTNVTSTVKEFGLPEERKKELPRKQNAVPALLVQSVNPVIDEILRIDSPCAEDVAVEMLLQVFSETLVSGHCESHNGRRVMEPMPRELTARAAEFLGSEDPFIHAVAEWAVSVNVCNENDGVGQGKVWPGESPPAWWDRWAAIPESQHLQLDYIRQAIALQMHRRGKDLLTLSRDQMRRAEEKARWARTQVPAEQRAQIDAAVDEMKQAHTEFASVVEARPDDLAACRGAYLEWRPTVRPVAMSGPDVDFDSVVYVQRFSGGPHGQPGAHLPSRWGVGGDIYVQDGLDPDSPVRALMRDKMPPTLIQDMDLWYDADKVVFAATDGRKNYQLWEIDIEGEQLTRLAETGFDDCDPAYLPDGGVVFGSTAAGAGVMCGNGSNSHTNIYRLTADRTETRRLSYCKDDDAYPYVLNDGRIVWMRWDYQERGVNEIFSLWVVRPDGTGADAFYRVHIPMKIIVQTLRDPEPVPGSQKIIATGGSHRTHNEGTLILADPTMGINNPLGIRTVTPYTTPTTYGVGALMRPVEEGGVPYPGGVIMKPQALSDKSFLVSMCYDMPQSCNFWLYYVDVWGNKELIHRDKLMETVCAMPLAPRDRPPVLPDMSDQDQTFATCYVDNVYADLPGVKKGEVKYIRVLQQLFWFPSRSGPPLLFKHSYRDFKASGGTGQGATRIIGTVPVEEDGSAHFRVPAGVDVYFQALDKDYRAVQRMRTHVEFGRGESRSCMGCHETRGEGVTIRPMGLALDKPPVRPTPPPWGDSTFIDYETMVQPVLEAKCVRCHGDENPKGNLFLTASRDEAGFMQSYRSLFGLRAGQSFPKNYRRADPGDAQTWEAMNERVAFFLGETAGEITVPRQFGSPQAPLAKKLVGDPGHRGRLTAQEMELIMTWLDVRAPYYAHYYQGRNTVAVLPFDPFGDSREHAVLR
jgi:hypothetical protein